MIPRLAALSLLAAALAGCSGLLSWQGGSVRPISSGRGPVGHGYVVVRPGDTLYSIAFRNNLDYHDLAAWNGIGSDYTIYPGQRLRLAPPSGYRRVARAHPSPTPSPPPPAQPPTRTSVPASAADDEVPFSRTSWRWPVVGKVVRGFDPGNGSKGINISGSIGETVVAAAPGKVVYSGSALKGYGQLIIIKHSERYLSAYGYNSRRLVTEGDWVKAGQPIARVGEGPEQQPELHFEIRDKGVPVDPLKLLPRR